LRILGIAGRYCAGKDAVVRILAGRGFRTIDVDAVGHEVLQEQRDKVREAFGDGVMASDGSVDRRALGARVFRDPTDLSRLESIVHPPMVEKVRALISRTGGNLLINAAVLHRMGLHALCDAVLWVMAPLPIRFFRAMKRDRLTPRRAWERIAAQCGLRPQCNGPQVDTYIVNNRGSMRMLERAVERILARIDAGRGTDG
jgi:dephospho-CoA kinase